MEETIGALISIGILTICTFLVGYIAGRSSNPRGKYHFTYDYSENTRDKDSIEIPSFMESNNA